MLHENGQVEPKDLEAHLKNDIEREDVKIAEMQRKMRQTFHEIVSLKSIHGIIILIIGGIVSTRRLLLLFKMI